ncbi:hypothetical protein [Pseudomonas sp. GL-B-19]|uniref:hypothetical protein n=1 Tax=Pseudomonas sp. GL-B-19 TaxID=2832393 RepID=UPI001CC10E51|nr:hypothetical protein [Pseudomonas sp. GL-B-19]
MKGATFNYDVNMGLSGESAFEFKRRFPKVPRITPPFPEKLAQELAQTSPAFCHPKTTPRRLTLAEMSRLDYCIYKQHAQGLSMDSYEIEDTSDWLGSPTRLETVKHYASMLEEDLQALKRELRAAKENITGLVEVNDQLSADLTKARTWLANREAETTVQLGEIQRLTFINDQLEKQVRALSIKGTA